MRDCEVCKIFRCENVERLFFSGNTNFAYIKVPQKLTNSPHNFPKNRPIYKSTMSGPISIVSQVTPNYADAVVRDTQNTAQVENKTHRETPTAPEAGTVKIAQATTDVAVSRGGETLGQIVVKNSDQSVAKMERMDMLNRDLGVSPVKSDIGTVADENALPPEINSRQSP